MLQSCLCMKNSVNFRLLQILDLPKRERINFKLFCVIAALSEKIKMLEPMIRKLINQLDFEALQLKMDRAKDLFYLLDDQTSPPASLSYPSVITDESPYPYEVKTARGHSDLWPVDADQQSLPRGTVSAKSLAAELAAGGVTSEHADQVIFDTKLYFML